MEEKVQQKNHGRKGATEIVAEKSRLKKCGRKITTEKSR